MRNINKTWVLATFVSLLLLVFATSAYPIGIGLEVNWVCNSERGVEKFGCVGPPPAPPFGPILTRNVLPAIGAVVGGNTIGLFKASPDTGKVFEVGLTLTDFQLTGPTLNAQLAPYFEFDDILRYRAGLALRPYVDGVFYPLGFNPAPGAPNVSAFFDVLFNAWANKGTPQQWILSSGVVSFGSTDMSPTGFQFHVGQLIEFSGPNAPLMKDLEFEFRVQNIKVVVPGGGAGPGVALAAGGGIPAPPPPNPTIIPEPCTLFLLGSGLAGIIGFGRKRLFKKA
jgi:hypothetical protein